MAIQNPKPRDPGEPMPYEQYLLDTVWNALATGGTPPEGIQIPEPILVISVSIRQWNSNMNWREKSHISRAVEGHVRGILLQEDPMGGCIRLDESHFLAFRTDWQQQPGAIIEHCRALVEESQTNLLCDVACCIGTPAKKEELPGLVDALYQQEMENVTDTPIVMLGQERHTETNPEAQMERWRLWLQDEKYDQLLMSVEEYFRREDHRFRLDSLHRFNQDFMQMLYGVMYLKQVPAHILFQRRENADVFRSAPDSIANTITWIFCAVTALSSHLESRRQSENYTHQAREYILNHLSRTFTRQDIADHVHLSQNHLARLFRQELGMSISDYILQERMKLAFEYLTNTTLPVYEVALRVGYENYSYFLTLFRRVAGMTPSQYREKYAEGKQERGDTNEE